MIDKKNERKIYLKPVIGISAYLLTKETNNLVNFDLNISPKELTDSLREAGGFPMIFPLADPKDAKEYIDRVDALVLTGGADVDPLLYLEEPHPKVGMTDPIRDEFELALIEEAWNQKKPIFGICRGLQLLNVASGGTLYQDLSQYDKLEVNHIQLTTWDHATHSILIEENSWMGEAMGTETVINSYHHQAINTIGDAFRPVAWSKDGIIEAIESIDKTQKTMAIQWHPEVLVKNDPESINIFKKFINLIDQK